MQSGLWLTVHQDRISFAKSPDIRSPIHGVYIDNILTYTKPSIGCPRRLNCSRLSWQNPSTEIQKYSSLTIYMYKTLVCVWHMTRLHDTNNLDVQILWRNQALRRQKTYGWPWYWCMISSGALRIHDTTTLMCNFSIEESNYISNLWFKSRQSWDHLCRLQCPSYLLLHVLWLQVSSRSSWIHEDVVCRLSHFMYPKHKCTNS